MNAPAPSGDGDPKEAHAIAGTILSLLSEHVSCSDEMLVAALKITANIVEETKGAYMNAQLRAGILRQYGGKR